MSSAHITTVEFHNDTLFAVEREDGVFVAVTPICQTLGLAPNKQKERIQADPILSEGGTVTVLPSAGGPQSTFCLRLDLVNGWLFTIDESRVKDEDTRQRVLAYKRECYRVLFQHFYGKATPRHEPAGVVNLDESLPTKRSLVAEARKTHGVQSARELWFKLGLPTTPSMYGDPRQPDFFYTAIRQEPTQPGTP